MDKGLAAKASVVCGVPPPCPAPRRRPCRKFLSGALDSLCPVCYPPLEDVSRDGVYLSLSYSPTDNIKSAPRMVRLTSSKCWRCTRSTDCQGWGTQNLRHGRRFILCGARRRHALTLSSLGVWRGLLVALCP